MSALVTGGAGGLAWSIAEGFARRGVPVVLVDLAEDAVAAAARRLADETGIATIGLACDITDRARVDAAWDEAEAAVGPIDHVVNCAGIFTPTPAMSASLTDPIR